jgi:nucleotide-binding universal stress UspA family protein
MDLFGKIAVASTFSPRFLPMLAEAKAVAALLDRPLEIIHAGEENQESRDRFAEALAATQISAPIHWRQAAEPSEAIVQAVRETGIDLLLAGAMDRDSHGRYFLGLVSRVLVHQAPCSMLLFANPSTTPRPFHTIVVAVDFTPACGHALKAALELATRAGATTLHVVRVFTVFAQLQAEPDQFMLGQHKGVLDAEEARLVDFVAQFDTGNVPVITRCVEGTTGFAAADFVQSIEADLLVVAAETGSGHTSFPARMEWLENVIPSNLLIVRPPAAD